MTAPISRRALLTGAAVAMPAMLTPSGSTDPSNPIEWLIRWLSGQTSGGGSGSTQQEGGGVTWGASTGAYGPDGSHWPADTPRPEATFGTVIDVACDWDAIGEAIASVSDAEIDGGVHVRIAPGTLPGFGGGAGSLSVLKKVGRGTASKNILVSPLDGWGTVTVTDSARLLAVKGVTFARINGRYLLLSDCSRTTWAQSKVSHGFRMVASNGVVRQCNAYEVVMADAKADINDAFGYAAGSGSMIADSVWEGCYCAPVFRPTGATDHLDSLQMYGNGAYRGLTVRDSTIFGSLNSALQLGGPKSQDSELGTPFLTVDHSILTSQAFAMRVRYPAPAGVSLPRFGQAINGSGESGQLYARDSYVFGSMYTTKWGEVEDSFTSYEKAPTNNTSLVGAWQYDPGMATMGAEWFDARTPVPTDDYLRGIWS